jgi:hypothetical protein
MATVQSEFGLINLFEDFTGPEVLVAGTGASENVYKDFRVIGDGTEDTDSGITVDEATVPLNGVGIFTTTNETKHGVYLATALMLNPVMNGPLVLETRVQFADLDSKSFFMGLCGANGDDLSLEDDVINGATATLTLTATDLCGFFYDEGLTEDEMWHCAFNGGTTTGVTVAATVQSGIDAVLGQYNILRLEVDPNGTARWYIDGVLKQTQTGAVTVTATDYLAGICGVESKATSIEYAYVDYFAIRAARDWTV